MSKKHINTTLKEFIQNKLNEIVETKDLNLKEKKYAIGSREYIEVMMRELNEIFDSRGYDNIHRH